MIHSVSIGSGDIPLVNPCDYTQSPIGDPSDPRGASIPTGQGTTSSRPDAPARNEGSSLRDSIKGIWRRFVAAVEPRFKTPEAMDLTTIAHAEAELEKIEATLREIYAQGEAAAKASCDALSLSSEVTLQFKRSDWKSDWSMSTDSWQKLMEYQKLIKEERDASALAVQAYKEVYGALDKNNLGNNDSLKEIYIDGSRIMEQVKISLDQAKASLRTTGRLDKDNPVLETARNGARMLSILRQRTVDMGNQIRDRTTESTRLSKEIRKELAVRYTR